MSPFRMSVVLVWASSICGCALMSRTNEGLEARLRDQQDAAHRLESELASTKSELRIARQESNALRAQLTKQGEPVFTPEQANSLFRTEGIRINGLLTGGLDRDETPGDEALSVVVSPIDLGGEVVKVPGSIELTLHDPTPSGRIKQIGSWSFDEDSARQSWHSGLLGKGYQFRLPWQTIPRSDKIQLKAKLTTTDGREFTTSSQVRVTPPTVPALKQTDSLFDVSVRRSHIRRIPDDIEQVSTEESDSIKKPIQTSDRWTDATIPRLR